MEFERFHQKNTILCEGGMDFEVAAMYIEHVETYAKRSIKPAGRRRLAKYAVKALRCNILRHYLDESFIGLSRRIAESPVLQKFIGVIAIDDVKVPSKSLLQKYSKFLPAEKISGLVDKAIRHQGKASLSGNAIFHGRFSLTICGRWQGFRSPKRMRF